MGDSRSEGSIDGRVEDGPGDEETIVGDSCDGEIIKSSSREPGGGYESDRRFDTRRGERVEETEGMSQGDGL